MYIYIYKYTHTFYTYIYIYIYIYMYMIVYKYTIVTIRGHILTPFNNVLGLVHGVSDKNRTQSILPGLELAANFRAKCAIRWGARLSSLGVSCFADKDLHEVELKGD